MSVGDMNFSCCLKPAAEASSLPPSCYTSPQIIEHEIDKIFRKFWIGVGRSDLVKSAGDYLTLDIAGQHILLLRDDKSKLRAFANVCRHRGARLVDGRGSTKGFRCPFHSWYYDLEGNLKAAPKMEEAKGFSKDENGLVAYQVEERFGFAFVCLSCDAPPIDDYLRDFGEVHSGWPIESLISIRRREILVECNWKLFLEVFNEYYHLPFVHPNTVDSIYLTPCESDRVGGAFATQFGKTDGTGGLLEDSQNQALPPMPHLSDEIANGARYTWVFPNMTFAANNDALWCYEAYPIEANRCKVFQTACFPPQTVALPEFEKKSISYLERLDAALAEDIPALINQQRGMSCLEALSGRFQPNLEANVASFAYWYASHVA